ncbi:MAG: histidinol dehydrogenase [Acidobacteria bacterium]|nr:histidinol dehydrogenase [Acidobacteriota bacterium]
MRVLSGQPAAKRAQQIAARSARFDDVEPRVRPILVAVRQQGDKALRRYAEQWDGLKRGQSVEVPPAELKKAWKTAAAEFRSSLLQAAANIRRFCEWQKPKEWTRAEAGVSLGVQVRPIEAVGCYIPGGRYPLVSTLLMTAIPAQVAGVKHIRVVSPRPSPEVLAAAGMLGITEFYRVGGAQAIAALAYGTKSIARVDKIVGPGNLYVTAAKKLVSFDCAIDMLAGPTEVVIVSDEGTPEFIASDLVAQAEHDPEAVSIFITTKKKLAESVAASTAELASGNATAQESLKRQGVILVAGSRKQAIAWANLIAPEHITVSRQDVPLISNAGSIFVGDYSPQAAGDYASGPNHVLPTAGVARFRGGLSVYDFVKLITVQELSQAGLQKIAPAVECLADTEGLRAHAESIRLRVPRAVARRRHA